MSALIAFPVYDPPTVDDLAMEAADLIEAYRRAPGNQVPDRLRVAKLVRCIELLEQLKEMEENICG